MLDNVSWGSDARARHGSHGGGAGEVQGVRALSLVGERDGVDKPVPSLGGVGKVGTGYIGIGHDDGVELYGKRGRLIAYLC